MILEIVSLMRSKHTISCSVWNPKKEVNVCVNVWTLGFFLKIRSEVQFH